MEEVRILVRRLEGCEDIPLPRYMSVHAAGMDLHAAVEDDIVLQPGKREFVPAGIQIALPAGYEAQIRPRSGLALKHGLTVLNTPGTVDADYRGEVGVIAVNHGEREVRITRGMRIAQMVIVEVARARLDEVRELPGTERGAGGFGHTG